MPTHTEIVEKLAAEHDRRHNPDGSLKEHEPGYPDNNPKTAIGTAKPGLRAVPPVALYVMGQAMADGEKKYGRYNWREHAVSSSVYFEAAMRHLLAWWDGEDAAADSGVSHLGHVMACMSILVDAAHNGKLNDDRSPFKGPLPEFIASNTKRVP